jgi:transposase-like protein
LSQGAQQNAHTSTNKPAQNPSHANNDQSAEALPNLTDEQMGQFSQMIKEGKGQAKIATALGISKQQVRLLRQQLEQGDQHNEKNESKPNQEVGKSDSRKEKKSTIEVIIPTPDQHFNHKEVSIKPASIRGF